MTRRLIITFLVLGALLGPAAGITSVAHAATHQYTTGYYTPRSTSAPASGTQAAGPTYQTNTGIQHPVYGSTYAGTWITFIQITCTPGSPADAAGLCTLILGPAHISSFENGNTIHCNARGSSCLYNGYFTAYASNPGAPYLCSNAIFSTVFNGTCSETERGSMDVMPGALGLPDFFITQEWASYSTTPPTTNVYDPAGVSNYPLDTLFPVVSGTYDTRFILEHLGLIPPGGTIPAGISMNMTVQHVTYWQ